MTNVAKLETPAPPKRKLLQQLADRYGVEPDIFERTVSAVAMPNPHTREELISCLIVANEHDLNPLTKEIHFMRTKTGQIVPIVGIDGWVKKLNAHPKFNGFEFENEMDGKNLVAVTCKIHMKDRGYPVVATELMAECIRLPAQGKGPNAWSMTPSRMLRHRALMQAARYAVGFGGVMDLDEFERWQAEMKDVTPPKQVLDVPDAIEDPVDQTPAVETEAEASQDAPFPDPDKYLAHLGEELGAASDKEIFEEIWTAHLEGSDGRLSQAHQNEATALYEKHGAKFEAKGKKKGKAKEDGGALL